MKIDGQATIMTGGASGLGGATAEKLAASGAKVAIFDKNADKGEAHANGIGRAFNMFSQFVAALHTADPLREPAEFAQLVGAIVENMILNSETIRLDGAIRMAAK